MGERAAIMPRFPSRLVQGGKPMKHSILILPLALTFSALA